MQQQITAGDISMQIKKLQRVKAFETYVNNLKKNINPDK